jgi:hypothetical protein
MQIVFLKILEVLFFLPDCFEIKVHILDNMEFDFFKTFIHHHIYKLSSLHPHKFFKYGNSPKIMIAENRQTNR